MTNTRVPPKVDFTVFYICFITTVRMVQIVIFKQVRTGALIIFYSLKFENHWPLRKKEFKMFFFKKKGNIV